ncbi:MAG: hypothetical protein GKR96_14310 [Gammaproteobacteria bacterium]|nr:hypothetical protein [Gammaproteobacteria bacterium]
MKLHPVQELPVDGENNPIVYHTAYAFHGAVHGKDLALAFDQIRQRHGPNVYMLPLGGKSGGGGIFQILGPEDGKVIGIQFISPSTPRITHKTNVEIVDG